MKKVVLLFTAILYSQIGFAQLFEDFEGTSIPTSGIWSLSSGNWRVFDNGIGSIQSWSPLSSTFFSYSGRSANVMREFVGAGSTSEDWLVMPQKLIRDNEQLRFFTKQGFLGNNGCTYQIRVSTNVDPTIQSAYVLLKNYTEDELIGPAPAIFSQYDEKIIDLTGVEANYLNQNVYIAFVKVNTQLGSTVSGDRWLIDNVRLVQKCNTPINLLAVNLQTTTARLKWDSNSTTNAEATYEVQWGAFPLDTNNPANQYAVANGNPTMQANQLFGLTPNTRYEYRVRAICGTGVSSNWTIINTFNTLKVGSNCSDPIAIPALPYSDSDNTNTFGDSLTMPLPGSSGCGVNGNFLGGTDVIYRYTPVISGLIDVTLDPYLVGDASLFIYDSCNSIGNNCLNGVSNSTGQILKLIVNK